MHVGGRFSKDGDDGGVIQGVRSELDDRAGTLISPFHRYQDMILRLTTDLAVPWTQLSSYDSGA